MRLNEIFSEKVTENGDIAFNKVGDNTLVNILFLTEYYQKHLNEVPTLGYSDKEQLFAMFIRDPRFGLGRRDLGRKLLSDTGYPGMKVLQFAFDGGDSDYLPHNYDKNCVVYTGTHDNDTIVGWFNSLSAETKKYALEYMNKDVSKLSVDSAGASDGFFE